MKKSKELRTAIQAAKKIVAEKRLEFLTPELLLLGICNTSKGFENLCSSYTFSLQQVQTQINSYFDGGFG